MTINFTYLPGDGIGPEVGSAAMAVLKAVAGKFDHTLKAEEHLVGGAAIDARGAPLPVETFDSLSRRRLCYRHCDSYSRRQPQKGIPEI